MKTFNLMMTVALLGLSAFAAEEKGLLTVPDVADQKALEAYLKDPGLVCLVDRDRALRLLDDAIVHPSYAGKCQRMFWRLKKAWIEMMTCDDKVVDAKIAAYMAVLTEPDPTIVNPREQRECAVRQMKTIAELYRLHQDVPFHFDLRPSLKKVKDRLPQDREVQVAYYEAMMRYMTMMWGEHAYWTPTLDVSCSWEEQLKVLEAGLSDPLLKGDVDFLKFEMASRYVRLERFADAEKVYAGAIASTNLKVRARGLRLRGDYWVSRAQRFYLPDFKPCLAKGLADYEAIYALLQSHPDPQGYFWQVANYCDAATDAALRLGDTAAVRKWLSRRTRKVKGVATVIDDDFANFRLGIIAWDAQDLDGTIAAFSKVSEKYITRERLLDADRVAHYAKLAKAYDMKGLYDEELKTLEVLKKKGGGSWKDYYAYVIEQVNQRKAAK